MRQRRHDASAGSQLEDREKVRLEATQAAKDFLEADGRVRDELLFQQTKQFRNEIQSYLDNVILESEVDEEMLPYVEQFVHNQMRLNAERQRKDARKQHCLLGRGLPAFQSCYVHPSCLPIVNPRRINLSALLHAADCWVVPDPAEPPEEVLWTACLAGGLAGLCVPSFDVGVFGWRPGRSLCS